MFKRDILIALEKWATKQHRKPLILRGARQVGKTSIVNEFGKQFDNYIYVNLENHQYKALFDKFYSIDQLLIDINTLTGKPYPKGRTLIFFDEIQNSAEAIKQLRYFYEEKPELYIIAAGSLLETLIDVNVSFPVGRVEYMAVHPVSFKEFLCADGKENLRNYLESSPDKTSTLHESYMTAFRNYSLIGGMPEVVDVFVNEHDINVANDIYDTLLRGYKDDVEKYAPNRTLTQVVRFLIDKGWGALAQKITLGNFANSSYKSREVGEAFRLLERAMLLELIYPNSNTDLPLMPQYTRSPKLIWLDIGLANYANKVQKDIFEAIDLLDAWRGAVAEQLVAQELITLSNRVNEPRYFWNKLRSDAEVDFEYIYDGHVVPIEVKSGHNSHLRSLHEFIDLSKEKIGVRVWSNPLQIDTIKTSRGKDFKLLNIPFYLISSLPQLLANNM